MHKKNKIIVGFHTVAFIVLKIFIISFISCNASSYPLNDALVSCDTFNDQDVKTACQTFLDHHPDKKIENVKLVVNGDDPGETFVFDNTLYIIHGFYRLKRGIEIKAKNVAIVGAKKNKMVMNKYNNPELMKVSGTLLADDCILGGYRGEAQEEGCGGESILHIKPQSRSGFLIIENMVLSVNETMKGLGSGELPRNFLLKSFIGVRNVEDVLINNVRLQNKYFLSKAVIDVEGCSHCDVKNIKAHHSVGMHFLESYFLQVKDAGEVSVDTVDLLKMMHRKGLFLFENVNKLFFSSVSASFYDSRGVIGANTENPIVSFLYTGVPRTNEDFQIDLNKFTVYGFQKNIKDNPEFPISIDAKKLDSSGLLNMNICSESGGNNEQLTLEMVEQHKHDLIRGGNLQLSLTGSCEKDRNKPHDDGEFTTNVPEIADGSGVSPHAIAWPVVGSLGVATAAYVGSAALCFARHNRQACKVFNVMTCKAFNKCGALHNLLDQGVPQNDQADGTEMQPMRADADAGAEGVNDDPDAIIVINE